MSASKKRRELNRARVEHDAARIAAGGAVSSKHLRDTTLEVALQAVDQLRAENRDLIMRNHITHELFETGDPGCPEQALDRNGEVVLGVCKNCGRVEADLAEPCDHRTLIANLHAEVERLKTDINRLAREQAQKMLDNGVYSDQLAQLRAENAGALRKGVEIPDALFDGHAVLHALTESARKRTGPENVSDVLDAAVRIIRSAPIIDAVKEKT